MEEILHQLRLVSLSHDVLFRVLYIPSGCLGFLPTTAGRRCLNKIFSSNPLSGLKITKLTPTFPDGRFNHQVEVLKSELNQRLVQFQYMKLISIIIFVDHPSSSSNYPKAEGVDGWQLEYFLVSFLGQKASYQT